MKKSAILFVILILFACTACKKSDGNTSSADYASVPNSDVATIQSETQESNTNSLAGEEQLKSYQEYNKQSNGNSEKTGSQDANSEKPSEPEKAKHFQTPQLGKYAASFYWDDEKSLYTYITLKENGIFSIESNYDLANWKNCQPSNKTGTYVLEDTSSEIGDHGTGGNITWLILYIDNRRYRTYAVGEGGNYFQDQEIVFNKID